MEVNEKKTLYKKIAKVKESLGPIIKKKTNPYYKSSYTDINSIIEKITPLFESNGLILLQPINETIVKTMIIDIEGGESIESSLKLPVLSDPQKIGSCITYYRRYTLQSLLGLQTEDDDGNLSSKKPLIEPKKVKLSASQFLKALEKVKTGGTEISEVIKKCDLDTFQLKQINSLSAYI